MMDFTQNQFSKAIEYLGAVEVAPGRYAYLRKHVDQPYSKVGSDLNKYAGRWFVMDTDKSEPRSDRMMPAWWSPEQGEAFRFKGAGLPASEYAMRFHTFDEASAFNIQQHGSNEYDLREGRLIIERIEADLETGAEVPA